MSWSEFLIWIIVGYILYYGVQITIDLIKKPKILSTDPVETLTFIDEHSPKTVEFFEDHKSNVFKSAAVEFKERKEDNNKNIENQESGLTGGLALSEFLKLAKTNAIQKSKSIAFSA